MTPPLLSFPLLSFNLHAINAWSFFPLVHTILFFFSCSDLTSVTAGSILWELPLTAWTKCWVNYSTFCLFPLKPYIWGTPASSFGVVTDANRRLGSKWVRVRMRKRLMKTAILLLSRKGDQLSVSCHGYQLPVTPVISSFYNHNEQTKSKCALMIAE